MQPPPSPAASISATAVASSTSAAPRATDEMSTCSTATRARRGHGEECGLRSDDVDVVHDLETRLRDLEREWDAYKTGRSGAARRHRRSRSATATPSSAVTATAPDGLGALLHCSPRRLLASLQQASDDSGTGSAGAVAATLGGGAGRGQARRDEQEDASVVCSSVEAGRSMAAAAAASSCSCPCRCAVLCRGYSTSSSCSAAAPSLSPAEGGVVGEHGTTTRVTRSSRARWFTTIALIVLGVAAMAILKLGMDEGSAEFLVPT